MSELIKPKYTPKQVRMRVSYSFWREYVNKIKHANRTEDIVRLTWEWMNDRMMFNTHKQSRFEAESAEMALADVLEGE